MTILEAMWQGLLWWLGAATAAVVIAVVCGLGLASIARAFAPRGVWRSETDALNARRIQRGPNPLAPHDEPRATLRVVTR